MRNKKYILQNLLLCGLLLNLSACLGNVDETGYLDETGYMDADSLLIATIGQNDDGSLTMHGAASETFIDDAQRGGELKAYINGDEQKSAVRQHEKTYAILFESVGSSATLKLEYTAPDDTLSKLEIELGSNELPASAGADFSESDDNAAEGSGGSSTGEDENDDESSTTPELTIAPENNGIVEVTIDNFKHTGSLYNIDIGAVVDIGVGDQRVSIAGAAGNAIYLVNRWGVLVTQGTVPTDN